MNDREQSDDPAEAETGPARLRAEARVRLVMAEATTKAERYWHDATSRAADVLTTHRQRALDTCRRIEAGARRSLTAPTAYFRQCETCGRPRHEEIAVRAYFKAKQRDFQAGQETDDWLTAERELLLEPQAQPRL